MFCPKDMLNKVEDSFPYRIEEGMMNIVNKMKRFLKKNMKSTAIEISKQYYMHSIDVSWAWEYFLIGKIIIQSCCIF
jgi:hypothetical protein